MCSTWRHWVGSSTSSAMMTIQEHNTYLTTTEVTMKIPDKSCRRSLSQQDRVIGLSNDHVPTIHILGG